MLKKKRWSLLSVVALLVVAFVPFGFAQDEKQKEEKIFANIAGGGTRALEVVISHDLDSGSLALLQTMHWKLAYLRRPFMEGMGKEGDRRSAQWVSEYTLECRAESANAKIQDISG